MISRLVEWAKGFVDTAPLNQLPAITQRSGDGVDGKLNALSDPRVSFACAVAFHQFDLEQVERLYIGQAKPDRVVQRGAGLKQMALPGRVKQAVA